MRLIQTLIVCALILFTTTGFAGPKVKQPVCHVGSNFGPNGETYLDDMDCVPVEENDYFCPDAGKIDLIMVPENSSHLGNDAHSFYEMADYQPSDVGASGEGKEDNNGNGIDDGCEPTGECPCWTEAEIATLRYPAPGDASSCNSADIGIIQSDSWKVEGDYEGVSTAATLRVPGVPQNTCSFIDTCDDGSCLNLSRSNNDITLDEYVTCTASLAVAGQERSFDCWD